MAQEALNRIAVLYTIEAEGRDLDCLASRALRAEKSLPALEALHYWLLQTLLGAAKLLPFGLDD